MILDLFFILLKSSTELHKAHSKIKCQIIMFQPARSGSVVNYILCQKNKFYVIIPREECNIESPFSSSFSSSSYDDSSLSPGNKIYLQISTKTNKILHTL